MEDFDRLIAKARFKNCRLLLQFDPDEVDEQWAVKFYPHRFDDGHYYGYHNNLNIASRMVLDELRGLYE